jgi:hypothetical protein
MDQLPPEIDESRRPWHFKQLKWTLQSLAQAGSVQPMLFPEQTPDADELAFGFEHWSSVVLQTYAADLSSDQSAALEAMSKKLATMSRDGAEFDVELWTDAALATSEHWAEVRQLASGALEAFGWAVDRPAEAADADSNEQ